MFPNHVFNVLFPCIYPLKWICINASLPEMAKLVTRILDGGIDFRKYVDTNIMMMFEGIPIAIIIERITSCQISWFCFKIIKIEMKFWCWHRDVGESFELSDRSSYVHLRICTNLYVFVGICSNLFEFVRISRYLYEFVRICTQLYVFLGICTNLYVHLHICMYLYIHVRILVREVSKLSQHASLYPQQFKIILKRSFGARYVSLRFSRVLNIS